jgi:hypothetical protein
LPAGEESAATMNLGLSYVAVTYHQIAEEAIVPLNGEGSRGLGFRAQLLFFLDDLAPCCAGCLCSDRSGSSAAPALSDPAAISGPGTALTCTGKIAAAPVSPLLQAAKPP